jgi:Flp pilus assembly pilin Flp
VFLRNNKGQAVKEFAILVAIAAAALVAMQMYVKRGLQGRLRDLGNQISGSRYEQTNTTSTTSIVKSGSSTETEHLGTYTMGSNDTTQVSANQTTTEP